MNIFYGERNCEGKYKSGIHCNNMAYYYDNKYLCGLHSNKSTRKQLPKNPNEYKNKLKMLEEREKIVESVAEENRKNGIHGKIICTKLYMMKDPIHYDGYKKVFPNYKHGNRIDGYGCPKLSPKSLGPINHGMKDLPIAKNLENFHQGAKVFNCEVDEHNKITKQSYEIRKKIYNSSIPYRHKFEFEDMKKLGKINKQPLFSIYYDKNNNEHRYNYIECRYFYCHYYEILVQKIDDFKILKKMLDDGYNLQIIGYDGYPISNLMEQYLDDSRPFGHELVLATMLILENKDEYPWNIYYNTHKHIYNGVI